MKATSITAGPGDGGQTLDFIVSNDNNPLFSTQPAVSATGALSYTSAPNASGSATVTVRVHDNGPGPADPLTGLIPAPGGPAGPGLGLWLIHQLTNIDIALLTGTDGFTVSTYGPRAISTTGANDFTGS